MNKAEMTKVLSFCAALDGQQVTEAKVLMWLQVLDGASYEDVQEAIVPAYTVSVNAIVTARGILDVLQAKSQPANAVMYLQDAQNLFNENAQFGNWEIDKKLAVMAEYKIGKIIVIAIDY